MHWIHLFLAIILEVCGTLSLKASNEFTNKYGILVAVFYLSSFYFLSKAISHIAISIAYAIWSGVGIVSLLVIGYFFFKEKIDLINLLFISLILVSVVGLQLRSTMH
ncbi:MAG: multidrug efflux SMR transporter [Cellvibrionaceae bacterium]|nr:multidrug efflux SMR transporter [Cellvibrionaceae bacterium]